MRVTMNTMTGNFVRIMHEQGTQMLKKQTEIATQKRVNRPSDDPLAMGRILGYRESLTVIDQYRDNIQRGMTRLEYTETVLGYADDMLRKARAIAEEYSGSGVTADQRRFAAEEIKDIYDQVMQMANSKFEEGYLFSGYRTDLEPFTRDADYQAAYQGNAGAFNLAVSESIEVEIDTDGRSYFQNAGGGGVNIFDELKRIIDGLEMADLEAGSAQVDAAVEALRDGILQVNNKQTEIGLQMYRLELTDRHWKSFKPKVEDALGREEDADLERAIMELKNLEIAYEITMATAARMMQPSLLNFLK
jgi:flagellar hook-associated protein 3 FlgL